MVKKMVGVALLILLTHCANTQPAVEASLDPWAKKKEALNRESFAQAKTSLYRYSRKLFIDRLCTSEADCESQAREVMNMVPPPDPPYKPGDLLGPPYSMLYNSRKRHTINDILIMRDFYKNHDCEMDSDSCPDVLRSKTIESVEPTQPMRWEDVEPSEN